MMGMKQMLEALGIEPRGIVYAGAHHGEHLPELLDCGFARVLLVEPNPASFALLERLESDRVRCVRAALAEDVGPVAYYAAPEQLDILNSIFEPDLQHFSRLGERAGTTLRFDRREVPGVTLERLLAPEPGLYNVLYMNIQGAELAALKGAGACLDGIEAIACEVDFVRRYRTGVLYADLKSHLEARGLEAAGLWRSEDPDNDYGMACFARGLHVRSLDARPVGAYRAGSHGSSREEAERRGGLLASKPVAGDELRAFASPDHDASRRSVLAGVARTIRTRRVVSALLAGPLPARPRSIVRALEGLAGRAAEEPTTIDRALSQLAVADPSEARCLVSLVRAVVASSDGSAFDVELPAATRFRWRGLVTPPALQLQIDAGQPDTLRVRLRSGRHVELAGEDPSPTSAVVAPRATFGSSAIDLIPGWMLDAYSYVDGELTPSPLETPAMLDQIAGASAFLAEAAPEYLAWVEGVVGELFPLDGRDGVLRSRSSVLTPGRVAASFPATPLALAELLVHEASHQYLELARELGPLDDGTDATLYWSPAVKTGRAVGRILVAHHAWANLCALFERCIDRKMDIDGYAARNLPLLRADLDEMTASLSRSRALTEAGRALWQRI